MSTETVTIEPEVVVKSRMAAYCARRRLGDVDLTQADMEALIQTAALVYWKHLRAGMPVPYCFVAARDASRSVSMLAASSRATVNLRAGLM